MTPRISIIIPLYNRAKLIERTLQSCIRQGLTDWEAIVVDDASTDASCDAVLQVHDVRIKLVRHTANQGQCVARNTGAQHATADWLLFLDSDDELTDGALDLIWQRASAVTARVGRLFFACRWDDGTISPDPPFDGRQLDYEGFVRWLERMRGKPIEAISVVRRSAFLEVPYPNRRTIEGGHNLDFMKRFDFVGYPDIVRLYHLDADNRLMDGIRRLDSLLKSAPGLAWLADTVLSDHGDALLRWSPTTYRDYLRSGGLHHLLSGNRARGVALAIRAWSNAPFSMRSATLVACSFMPIRTLARIKVRASS